MRLLMDGDFNTRIQSDQGWCQGTPRPIWDRPNKFQRKVDESSALLQKGFLIDLGVPAGWPITYRQSLTNVKQTQPDCQHIPSGPSE